MDARIEGRLRDMQAVDLQKLAEQLALVLRPDTFNRAGLVIRGRNLQQQTTKGWPDAYVQAADGRVFAVEATRNATSWRMELTGGSRVGACLKVLRLEQELEELGLRPSVTSDC